MLTSLHSGSPTSVIDYLPQARHTRFEVGQIQDGERAAMANVPGAASFIPPVPILVGSASHDSYTPTLPPPRYQQPPQARRNRFEVGTIWGGERGAMGGQRRARFRLQSDFMP